MTKRILALSYWILMFYVAVANGQSFDRLLPPTDYHTRKAEAYQAGVREALRDTLDYRGLREHVVRRYESDRLGPLPPVRPDSARQYVDRDYSQFERFSRDNSRYDDRAPAVEVLRERERREPWYRGGATCDGPGCRGYEPEPYSNYRPIGYDLDRYDGEYDNLARRRAYELAARHDASYGTQPDVCRSYRNNVDRDGNYIGDNVYGKPRVFNPDQPIRNLFRYVFP